MRAENHTPSQATPPDRLPPDRPPLDRPPLGARALRRAVIRPGGLWQAFEVTAATGSTNADLLAQAMAGAPEGVVLAAEEQAAGGGRMGRTWGSPARGERQ